MKIKSFAALLVCMASAAAVGCSTDPTETGAEVAERIPLQLSGDIQQESKTRVNDSGFCDGDAVGIYVVNYAGGAPGTLLDAGNQVDNVRFVLDEAAGRWVPDYEVYYYDKTTHVDIIGYYPYSPAVDEVGAYPFEVAKDQSADAAPGQLGGYEASDFLWGKAADVVPTAQRVNIVYKHRMAGVLVELTDGGGFAEGEWATLDKQVLVANTVRRASIDLSTGSIAAVGEAPATGIVPSRSGEAFRAVVVPQTIAASTALFKITVDGTPYTFRKNVSMEYSAGKLHKFTISIKKKETGGLEFALLGESITAWENDAVSHDASAREYVLIDVPAADESQSALKAAIAAAGKNCTKIKNLKVTGQINALDLQFMRDEMTALQSVNLKEVDIAACPGYPANEIHINTFRDKSSLVRFVFPDRITKIGDYAFYGTNLTGSLIIPNGVTEIGDNAFAGLSTLSGTLTLPKSLVVIGSTAFSNCSGLTGTLDIPSSVKTIGSAAFHNCSGFTGSLILPEGLTKLGYNAFGICFGFTGSLAIPEKITKIEGSCFRSCSGLNGQLTLPKNLTEIEDSAFANCKFRGTLELPKSLLIIGEGAFYGNKFGGELILPQSVLSIGNSAFYGNSRLTGVVEIPEEIISIAPNTFAGCSQLEGVVLPKGVESIREYAFQNCYQLNSITCKAQTPPQLAANAFYGVAKDNFTVEVPEASVAEYTTAPNWNEFKRFAAHRNFSISRNRFRALNAELSKTLVLRAESGAAWSVESKPDWVRVTPASGTGKTEVTLTVDALAKGAGNRTGEVVFLLDGKDYRSKTLVEQYDYAYGDGDVIENQRATRGAGVDLVFMGDCFDAKDIAEGKYVDAVNEAIGYYFDIEPYATYRDYFNVYTVIGLSPDSGIGTVNTIREAKFGSQYGLQGSGTIAPDEQTCFEYACKAPTVTEERIGRTLVVLIENTEEYDGITYMWGDGSAVALCPMSRDVYPYDFRGIVQHEAGGHGFGKLGDEYIYHNAFIQSCICNCCPHVEEFNTMKSRGWYENLSLTGNMYEVPWSHLIFDEKYQNTVDIYEGGYMHSRGVFRSESNSCMNNNIPYYSAVSREAIVKRIMEYAGESYSFEQFKANDRGLAAATTSATRAGVTNYVEYAPLGGQHSPVYMGEKPDFRSNK